MLLNILAIVGSSVVGFLFFWAVSWRRGPAALGPPVLGFKYLGFKNYAELRSHLIGKNFLWGTIIGVGSVFLVVELGLSESFWVVSFLLGYGFAIWRFLAKPKKAWDDESLPIWHA
jgi:hypothetical protein